MRYSKDFRKKVVSFLRAGENKKAVAIRFGISRTTVHAWSQNESLESLKPGPKAPRKLNLLRLQEIITQTPDAYQDELAVLLGVSPSTVGHHLRKLGYRRKKNHAISATR
jgi:transposase